MAVVEQGKAQDRRNAQYSCVPSDGSDGPKQGSGLRNAQSSCVPSHGSGRPRQGSGLKTVSLVTALSIVADSNASPHLHG